MFCHSLSCSFCFAALAVGAAADCEENDVAEKGHDECNENCQEKAIFRIKVHDFTGRCFAGVYGHGTAVYEGTH